RRPPPQSPRKGSLSPPLLRNPGVPRPPHLLRLPRLLEMACFLFRRLKLDEILAFALPDASSPYSGRSSFPPGGHLGILDKLRGKKPAYDEFAQEFRRAMAAAGARDIRHDPAAHSLRTGSGEATHYLDNAFRDYLAASAGDRAAVI